MNLDKTDHGHRWDNVIKSNVILPLDKIKNNITENKGVYIIMLSTGSYCPIHKMHVELMEIAKEYIEKKLNLKVIGGFLSPSSDTYVLSKVQRENGFIPAVDRIKLCKEVLATSNWLECSDWEVFHKGWGSPAKLLQHMAKYIEEQFPDIIIRPIYVCGADHALKYQHYNTEKLAKEEIVVMRPGYSQALLDKAKEFQNQKNNHYFHIVEHELLDCSSTQIRESVKTGKDISHLTYPAVIDYLKQNKK